MENASHHSVRVEDAKPPTFNSRKVKWLDVQFGSKFTNPELYEIMKSKKIDSVYKVDEILKKKGHEVLRLPPYPCGLNHIELIWGDLNGFVVTYPQRIWSDWWNEMA